MIIENLLMFLEVGYGLTTATLVSRAINNGWTEAVKIVDQASRIPEQVLLHSCIEGEYVWQYRDHIYQHLVEVTG